MKRILILLLLIQILSLVFSENDPFKMPDIDMNINKDFQNYIFSNDLFSEDFNKYMNELNNEWKEHLSYMNEEWRKLYEENQKEWDKYYEEYYKQEKEFMTKLKKIWGETFEYNPHKWYDFSDDLKSFTIVSFNEETKNGEIEVNIIVDKNASKEEVETEIKRQLKKTIEKKDEYTKKSNLNNLIEKKDIENPQIKKDKVVNNKIIYTAKIPIKKNPFLERAKDYITIINNVKTKYGISRPFILSIIQKESSFLPKAKSKSGALGLMQLIPRYAATEAYIYLYNRKPNPRSLIYELYNPEKNILYGATYIYLLHTKYFKFETDYGKRKYMVITGYNMGPIAISKKIRGLNLKNMDLKSLYNYLLLNTRKETADYLRKVLNYEKEWNNIYP
ncbi:membrane-bound lytic murein transglycosylase MltC [Marinitoga arctica]